MGVPDGAHTHGGGGGLADLVLLGIGVVLVGPAVTAALVALVHVLFVVAAAVAAVATGGVVAFGVWRWRHPVTAPWERGELSAAVRPPLPRREPQAISQGQHLHIHLAGLPEDAQAEVLSRLTGGQ